MVVTNVITSMLDDLSQQQPISTALCLGQDLNLDHHQSIQWLYFNVTEFLILPFTQRYDLAVVLLDSEQFLELNAAQKSQVLVKLRDLLAKRIMVLSASEDAQLLRSLGFTQLQEHMSDDSKLAFWQFNILTYKHVPDWFNSKFWANPENWNKFRW